MAVASAHVKIINFNDLDETDIKSAEKSS